MSEHFTISVGGSIAEPRFIINLDLRGMIALVRKLEKKSASKTTFGDPSHARIIRELKQEARDLLDKELHK